MLRLLPILALIASASTQASPWFDGAPEYVDNASQSLAQQVLEAHGGMQPMASAKSLQFNFFTKMIGGPMPFYSLEAVDLATGNAYIEWPFWDSNLKSAKTWQETCEVCPGSGKGKLYQLEDIEKQRKVIRV